MSLLHVFLSLLLAVRVHTGNDPAHGQRHGQAAVHVSVQGQAGQNSGRCRLRTHFLCYFTVYQILFSPDFVVVSLLWSRFPRQAASRLRPTPASRSQPVNSAWGKRSWPRRPTSTGFSWTRRSVSPLRLVLPLLLLHEVYVFNVLFCVQMVQAFTHAPASVDGERGGKFRLLEGNVFGEFTELVRRRLLPLLLEIKLLLQ